MSGQPSSTIAPLLPADQRSTPNPAPFKRTRVYPKRVPNSIPLVRRKVALQTARIGRSIHDTAAELGAANVVVIEEWFRAHDREIRDLRDRVAVLEGRRLAA